MYYFNKNDQIFKISQLTILKWIYDYNDARYMYIKYKDSTKQEFIKSYECDWSSLNACWQKVLNVC